MWNYRVILAACVMGAAGAFAVPEENAPASTDEAAAMEEAKPERPAARRAKEDRGPGNESKRPGAGLRSMFEAADKNDDGKLSFEEAQAQWPRLSEERFKALDKNADGFVSREEAPRPAANRNRVQEEQSSESDGMQEQKEKMKKTEKTEKKAASDAMAARGQGRGGEYLQRLTAADSNADGRISRDEWKAAFGEGRMERFEELRGNRDEDVSLDAIRKRMRARNAARTGGDRIDPEERRAYLGRLIETLDKDDNGEVSWEEFNEGRPGLPRPAFDRMDANEDGVLSEGDLAGR